MDFDMLLESCGYLATFMGTLLEGEISLLTSVVGAQSGYYNFYGAMLAAFGGAYIADWFKFLIAKNKGQLLLEKKPSLKGKLDANTAWFEKHPFLILTFYKFFLGFTTVVLLMAGLKNISYTRYAIHSAISIALWVAVLGGLGYHCADAMISNIQWVSDNVSSFIAILVATALSVWLFKRRPKYKECLEVADQVVA